MDSPAEPTFEMHLTRVGRRLTVALAGELDAAESPLLIDLAATMTGTYDHVIVDASQLTFVDSSGLRGLIALRNSVARLSVRNAGDRVRWMIETTNLAESLGLHD